MELFTVIIFHARTDRDKPRIAANRLDRVGHEIEDNLLNQRRVANHIRRIAFHLKLHDHIRRQHILQKLFHAPHHFQDAHLLIAPFALPHKGQHLHAKVGSTACGIVRHIHRMMGFRIGRQFILDKFLIADHRLEQVVEIVGDAPRHQAQAVHFLRTPHMAFHAFPVRFSLQALAHIRRNQDKALLRIIRINRTNGNMTGE